MGSPAHASTRIRLVVGLFLTATVTGCGGRDAQVAIDRQIKDHPQYKKENVVKLSGRVTVDGQPPAAKYKLFVILNDPAYLDENSHRRAPRLCATCDDQGKFAFGTYDNSDGVPAGKYVATFVALHAPAPGKPGLRRLAGTSERHFSPPDELKNLYNDPNTNRGVEQFVLNLEPSGKHDYEFDLSVAGKEPVMPPGPNAVTTIIAPR
jgi:hypothetical protein